jgi:hypothetical protein
MRVGEIRKELESYGIKTKSFLEKKEMVDALLTAREKWDVTVNGGSSRPMTEPRPTPDSTSQSPPSQSPSSANRNSNGQYDQYAKAFQKASQMKISEIKDALTELGIDTSSFFEKSEFVRAYANAVAARKTSSSSAYDYNDYDTSYREVILYKMDKRDPRLLKGTVIDVKSRA